jgi:L-lysine 2,3-aminomutase
MDQPPLFELFSQPEPGKRCCHCKAWKPLTDFNRMSKSLDGRQARCRECNKAYHYENWERHMSQIRGRTKRVTRENQRNILEYLLAHPCVDCGESDPVVLQFDHLRDKRKNVGAMIRGYPWSTILEEIEKCVVRCANCHARRTMSNVNSWRTHGIREDDGTLAFDE